MIEVKDSVLDGEPVRYLLVDGAGESAMYLSPEKQNEPVFAYGRTVKKIQEGLPEPRTMLMIGGAGLSVPRYFFSRFPDLKIDVVEKDARMIRIGKKFFGMGESAQLSITKSDGLKFLRKLDPARKYDLIFDDAFNGFDPEKSLLTNEAVTLFKSHLAENGTYLVNLITALKGQDSMLGIMQQAILKNHFAYVKLTRCKEWKALSERQNCVFAASDVCHPFFSTEEGSEE